jgi:hypothetical protein
MGLLDYLDAMRKASPSAVGVGQLSEAEAARLSQLQMQQQMDEMSRVRQMTDAYGMGNISEREGNTIVNAMRQMNPMGNTMQNIPANVGGMNVRNAQPPMDINTLLRVLGYR